MKPHGERESKKLSSVIEGAVCVVLVTEKGREYIKSRKVSSVHDVVQYLENLRGESDNWLARVQSDITDYLLHQVSQCIPCKLTLELTIARTPYHGPDYYFKIIFWKVPTNRGPNYEPVLQETPLSAQTGN